MYVSTISGPGVNDNDRWLGSHKELDAAIQDIADVGWEYDDDDELRRFTYQIADDDGRVVAVGMYAKAWGGILLKFACFDGKVCVFRKVDVEGGAYVSKMVWEDYD